MKKVGLVDYGASNLRSVHQALVTVGAEVVPVTKEGDLEGIEKLVFPGQGAFGESCEHLHRQSLFKPIARWVGEDRPYFGICLGYQLLFEESEEAPGTAGLGALPGKVVRFPDSVGKIPHMGWNTVGAADPSAACWSELPADPHAYFVHSYYPAPAEENDVASTTEYGGVRFASSIRRGNVMATQFHPEKSQDVGLQILRNFLAG